MSSSESSENVIEKLEKIRNEVDMIMQDVRRFSHKLRPDILDWFGLIPALRLIVNELNEQLTTVIRLEIVGSNQRLPAETELALFRIAQEALNNTRKHAEATEVLVSVKFAPDEVEMGIIDNGKGFELNTVVSRLTSQGKLGLVGMRERVRILGGRFMIESDKGKGTAITVKVPV